MPPLISPDMVVELLTFMVVLVSLRGSSTAEASMLNGLPTSIREFVRRWVVVDIQALEG